MCRLRHPLFRTIAPILCALWSASVAAQTIYRCGNSYSQTPCAGAVSIVVDDSRTAQQKSQTDAATVQTRQLANQLEQERVAQEKAAMAVGPRQDAGKVKGQGSIKGTSKSDAASATNKPRTHPKKRKPELELYTAPIPAQKKIGPATSKGKTN